MPIVTKPDCVHHWIIAPANMGLPSQGVCKKCKAVKEFKNSIYNNDINPWAQFKVNNESHKAE